MTCSPQTFRTRLPEVVDQAQHFASINAAGGSGGGSETSLTFREGMDGSERECTCRTRSLGRFADLAPVFVLAQESAKRTKLWYESTDLGRR